MTINMPMVKWGLDVSKAPAPVQASLEPIIRFFSFHDAHPVALMLVLMEKFGTEWLDWEAETLKSEILTTFRATSVSEQNWQKIQAIRVLTSTTGFWEEWHIFEKIIQALNNNFPRFDITQRCTISQLMSGVDVANTIRKETYHEEIQRYVSACALDEGVLYLPSPLDFAQKILSEPSYVCKVCGNVDIDDLDGRCDVCTARFSDDHPLNMKPAKMVPKDAGTHLEKFVRRDPSSIEKRLHELQAKSTAVTSLSEDKPEDVQAAKLMVACEYTVLRNQQLVEQLEELKSWVTH
jgi:rubrerythrin